MRAYPKPQKVRCSKNRGGSTCGGGCTNEAALRLCLPCRSAADMAPPATAWRRSISAVSFIRIDEIEHSVLVARRPALVKIQIGHHASPCGMPLEGYEPDLPRNGASGKKIKESAGLKRYKGSSPERNTC